MKKIVAALLAGATLLLGQGIHWETGYKAAVAEAQKLKKPILFVFSSHACKWCRHRAAMGLPGACGDILLGRVSAGVD